MPENPNRANPTVTSTAVRGDDATDTLTELEEFGRAQEYAERIPRSGNLVRLRLLWDQRRLLMRAAVWGLVVTSFAVFLLPKKYTSTTRLMPPDQQHSSVFLGMLGTGAGASAISDIAANTGSVGALAGSMLGVRNSGTLFVGVLHSRTIADGIIRKFDLRKVYWVSGWEKARKQLDKRTDIAVDAKSGILTIKVTDSNPQRAAAIAAEYVAELNAVVNNVNTSAAHRERQFLEQRLQEVKADLQESEKEFSQFASKNTAIDIKEQGKAMVGAAATLQGELIAAESQLQGLKQIYTGNNVRIKSAEARVLELRHALQRLGGGVDGTAGDDAKDSSLYPSMRKLPLLGVTYADLYRRTKINEAIFEALTREYELSKIEEAKDMPSVKVLDPAETPEQASFPPILLTIVIGTAFALILAAGWILGKELWYEIDPNAPAKLFAQEVFGTLKSKLPAARRRTARV